MKTFAIKSQEFSRARFALRKVHLANIDRNNLRFNVAALLAYRTHSRGKRRNGRDEGNKIKSSLERARANASVCMRSVAEISSSRETFCSTILVAKNASCRKRLLDRASHKNFCEFYSARRIHNLQNPHPSLLFHGRQQTLLNIARIFKLAQTAKLTHISK